MEGDHIRVPVHHVLAGAVCGDQCEVALFSVHYSVCGVPYRVCNVHVQCVVCNIQKYMGTLQYALFSVLCFVASVECGVDCV